MTLALRYAARSHQGLLRPGNEDSVYAGPRLLAVADGMGGHAAGEVASAVAVAALAPLDEDVPGPDLLEALRRSALSANDHLHAMMEGDPSLEGMGTTLTVLLSAGNRVGLLHVGDSRCYLLRDGELTQITHDHTLVQTLVDEGRISEDEATTHPQRSLITRALDGREGLQLDLSVREVREGDRYLLCSDGLTGPVARKETLREALTLPDPQEAVDRLVQLALRGGGPDNVTVIVADVVDAGRTRPGPPIVAGAAAETPQAPPPGIADSAASRARTAEGRDTPRPTPMRTDSAAPRPGHGRRAMAIGLCVALVLLVGAAVGWAYVRAQYFVGVDQDTVAVFQGVTGSVAGIPLAKVAEHTTVGVDRLSELDVQRVQSGIVAKDRVEAGQIVQRLREIAACPSPAPSAAPTTPAPSASAPARPSASASVSASAKAAGATPAATTTLPAAGSPTPTPGRAGSTSSTRPAAALVYV